MKRVLMLWCRTTLAQHLYAEYVEKLTSFQHHVINSRKKFICSARPVIFISILFIYFILGSYTWCRSDDWECVLTFKTALCTGGWLWGLLENTPIQLQLLLPCDSNRVHGAIYACWNGLHASVIQICKWKWTSCSERELTVLSPPELPSLLAPLQTCQGSSNGHSNQWSDDVLHAYRPMVAYSSSSCECHCYNYHANLHVNFH